MSKKKRKTNKENVYNIPNTLTIIRIILSIVLFNLAINGADLGTLVIIFVIAALTDGADGYIARNYNQITNFGRRLDPIADRILTISAVISLLIYLDLNNFLTSAKIYLILITMSRELLCAPIFIFTLFRDNTRKLPHARLVGKATTLLQGITFPMIILGWSIGSLFAIITAIMGTICLGYYTYDSIINPNNEFQKKQDRFYESLNYK
jgi:CDP-diacylglycerol--glycerol-3-phosphate 3-phosphatidyltransferase